MIEKDKEMQSSEFEAVRQAEDKWQKRNYIQALDFLSNEIRRPERKGKNQLIEAVYKIYRSAFSDEATTKIQEAIARKTTTPGLEALIREAREILDRHGPEDLKNLEKIIAESDFDELNQEEEIPSEDRYAVGTTVDDYEIVQLLRKVSFGRLFKVKDRRWNENFFLRTFEIDSVLKGKFELRPEEKAAITKRFVKWIKTIRKIRHPNISPVLQLNENNGTFYVISEFFPQNLGRMLTRANKADSKPTGPLFRGPGRAVNMVIQICDALSAMHKLGIIHGDLQPDHIYIESAGALTDGFCVGFPEVALTGDKSKTSDYLAPEQIVRIELFSSAESENRERLLEPRFISPGIDIYAAGLILYRLAVGDFQLDRQSLRPILKWPERILNPQIKRIIERAAAVSPAERYKTIDDFMSDLQEFMTPGEREWRKLGLAPSISEVREFLKRYPDSEKARDKYETMMQVETRDEFEITNVKLRLLKEKMEEVKKDLNLTHSRIEEIKEREKATDSGSSPEYRVSKTEKKREIGENIEDVRKIAGEALDNLRRESKKHDADEGDRQTAISVADGDKKGITLFDKIEKEEILLPEAELRDLGIGKLVDDYTERYAGIDIEMIYIPGGTFLMGAPAGVEECAEAHRVTLRHFFMSKYPITNRQYKIFLEESKYDGMSCTDGNYLRHLTAETSTPTGDDYPVVWVSWANPAVLCKWLQGKTGRFYSLPTEAQWEFAARGTDGRLYPWGEDAPIEGFKKKLYRCNCDGYRYVGHPTIVGKFHRFRSPFDCEEMAGNVWEWCLDGFSAYPKKSAVDPIGSMDGQYRVIRGGSWFSLANELFTYHRNWINLDYTSNSVGFRLACQIETTLDLRSKIEAALKSDNSNF